ncbi:hypothetical protein SDC9_152156 [bioreactor metagenome]|uniref:Uncharacterized protein n=1 Tax=bioreactor metagenome TaxID=1076179 RepID=A0A645ESB0_9ZZZZ
MILPPAAPTRDVHFETVLGNGSTADRYSGLAEVINDLFIGQRFLGVLLSDQFFQSNLNGMARLRRSTLRGGLGEVKGQGIELLPRQDILVFHGAGYRRDMEFQFRSQLGHGERRKARFFSGEEVLLVGCNALTDPEQGGISLFQSFDDSGQSLQVLLIDWLFFGGDLVAEFQVGRADGNLRGQPAVQFHIDLIVLD